MIKGSIILKDGQEINFDLFEDIAPITVSNFINLAKNNFYNNLIFHRVIKNFMIQAGAYYIEDGVIRQKEADSIIGEFSNNGIVNPLKHELGILSMARTNEKNSASSQFFICIDNCSHLDGQYAAFGKVSDEKSLKVLKSISLVKTTFINYMFADFPVKPIIIEKIIIKE